MQLTIIPDGKKFRLETRINNELRGTVTARLEGKNFAKAASTLGIQEEHIYAIFDSFVNGGNDTIDIATQTDTASPPRFTVRPETGHVAGTAEAFTDEVLQVAGSVIEWADTDTWCALDLDFHEEYTPDATDLSHAASKLLPRPHLYWRTRRGGLRCVYQLASGYTASEIASVAALALRDRFPLGRFELLHRTRTPPGPYVRQEQLNEVAPVRRLLGQYVSTDSEYAEWLENRGFAVGGRYSHEQCPVRPSKRASANSGPVMVYEDHVYCHICNADGIKFGSGPGWFPASRLAGSQRSTLLATMVRKLCHYEHAKHGLADLPNAIQRPVYSAALKLTHGPDDPRIPLAFSSGDNLIRLDGAWSDRKGFLIHWSNDPKKSRLRMLPACQYVNEDGEIKVSESSLAWLTHPGDISQYGYPAINLVRGIRLTEFLPGPQDQLHTVVPGNVPSDRAARYVTKGERLPLEVAFGHLETLFPRLNRNALLLYLAAKGCTENPTGLPPFIFAHGYTGAAKTSTLMLAAEIAGDSVTNIEYSPSKERVRQSLIAAKTEGTYAAFDEFLKGAKGAGKTPVSAMEMLLNFTPRSVSHIMYVGPKALGSLPVCVWSDTDIPVEVSSHAQLARRLTVVPFLERVDWEQSLASIGEINMLRTRGTKEQVDAANAILSHVIDTYFMDSMPVFRDVATSLGFHAMESMGTLEEKRNRVRKLYELVCRSPKVDGGYAVIDLHQESDLLACWRTLHDTNDPYASNAVKEEDLRRLLGKKNILSLDIRQHGSKIQVRFASQDGKLFNEEIT